MVEVLRAGDGASTVRPALSSNPAGAAVVACAALVVKRGGTPDECEDRIAWRVDDAGVLYAAVADGASASLFAGEWAEALAVSYCRSGDAFGPAAIHEAANSWGAFVARQELPWYAQAKAGQGAFAALAGVSVRGDGAWSVRTAGDCCVFHVREERLIDSYPTDRAEDFSHVPILLGTAAPPDALNAPRIDAYEPGDDLYLMTDALAAWMLRQRDLGYRPWNWIAALEADENRLPFDRWIDDMRDNRRLQNDDVALLHLRLGERRP